LRAAETLSGRSKEPLPGAGIVERDAVALQIHRAKIVLCDRIALLGLGLEMPHGRCPVTTPQSLVAAVRAQEAGVQPAKHHQEQNVETHKISAISPERPGIFPESLSDRRVTIIR